MPRRADRTPLSCEVEFRRQGDHRFKIDLVDLSLEGCCIAPPIRVEVGDVVGLRVPGLESIYGKIMWVEEWKAGVRFDRPFHPAVFEQLVRKLAR